MEFLLVEWVEEARTYSVVSKDRLVDGTLRALSQELVGKVAGVFWRGKKVFMCKILEIGETEGELTRKADELASIAETDSKIQNAPKSVSGSSAKQNSNGRPRKTAATDTVRALDEVLGQLDQVDADFQDQGADTSENQPILNTEQQGQGGKDYEEKYRSLKRKYKDLKKTYKSLQQSTSTEAEIEIYPGSGVTMNAGELASIKLVSNEPTVTARNLFRRLFTVEELSTHSLFGKKCNANKDAVPLSRIDQVRSNAVIGYIFNEAGLDGPPPADLTASEQKSYSKKKKALRREVIKSLSEFLRAEARKISP
ncbi:uncharacterized protein LOC118436910 [Folsomia candida]|uniref:BEN domain-containing protein n=1 Tax=Folsomia candida TaxID=158441 RepID=A0A226DTY7_FOLCA|nr:uncharacterized protein LOC118436910 [Folsomia candida]OXA48520.1 hypothetical protein Fcan01_16428 [Folsomia candida]